LNFFTSSLNLIILGLLLVINHNQNSNGADSSIKEAKFLSKAIKLSVLSTFSAFFMMSYIRARNSEEYENIAIANNILFSAIFHLLAGLLRSYLFSTSDPLVFIISIEVAFRYIIATYYYQSYRIMKISAMIIISYIILLTLLVHENVPQSAIYYILMKVVVLSMLTINTKYIEEGKMTESSLNTIKENEKNYYLNMLNKLNIGFFITTGTTVKLYNEPIKNLFEINKTKKKDITPSTKLDSLLKPSQNSIRSESSFKIWIENTLDYLYLKEKKSPLSNDITNEKLREDEEIYRFLENVFKQFKSFNNNLPKQYEDIFNSKDFKLSNLRKLLENDYIFDDYIKIGILSLNNDKC